MVRTGAVMKKTTLESLLIQRKAHMFQVVRMLQCITKHAVFISAAPTFLFLLTVASAFGMMRQNAAV